jgi:RES domain-containing protein
LSLTIWRIVKRKRESDAFRGEGASQYPGRWNSEGNKIVYTSANLSLAALETFVHMKNQDAIELSVAIRAEIPDNITIESLTETEISLLNWRNDPAPPELAKIGDEWLASKKAAVFCVPSAIIPVENNYLLNPLHPDFSKIIIHPRKFFGFDRRMWK